MFEKKDFSQLLETMRGSLQQNSETQFDFQEGSVVRTLFESFAYEMAVLYEQMERVYLSAYVDSAEDTDLDKVVAILGIKRGEPEYAMGKVTFERDVGIDEEIEIPINTLVTTEDTDKFPKKAYKTIELQTIPPGESKVTVRIQAEDFGKNGETEAETIIVMPQPVTGVKSVNNQEKIQFRGKEREKDAELRNRAKETLLAASGANATSIKNALLGMPGVKEVKIKEEFKDANNQEIYGLIDVFVDAVDFQTLQAELKSRIDQVRAAGVYVRLKEPTKVAIDAIFQVTVDPQRTFAQTSERELFEQNIENEITNYLKQLEIGESLVYTQLIRHLLGLQGVSDLNEVAIAIYENNQRTEYILSELAQKKQIKIADTGKIFPRHLRVTSETERLYLIISLQFQFTELAEISKTDLIQFFNGYFSNLPRKQPVTKTAILAYIADDKNQIKGKKLTIVENSLKLLKLLRDNSQQEVEQIEISYLEQAQTDEQHLFAYSKILHLIGAVKFTSTNPITTQEKQTFQEEIQQQIDLYLNQLQPQSAIDLNDLRREIQQEQKTLLIEEFNPGDFQVTIDGQDQLETRLDDHKITVRDFEKVKSSSFCITNTTENADIEVSKLQLTIKSPESDQLATQVSEAVSTKVNQAVAQAEAIVKNATSTSDKIKEAISEELSETGSTVEEVIKDNAGDSDETPTLSDAEQSNIKQTAREAIEKFTKPAQGKNLIYESFKQAIEGAVNGIKLTILESGNYVLQVTELTLVATSNSDRRIQNITIEQPQDIHIRSVEVINSINPPAAETIKIIVMSNE